MEGSSAAIHTLHVVLAGIWLGGVVFTTAIVSPALKAMKWDEAERVGIRLVIGRRYARVGIVNLALLLIFAVLDELLKGFSPVFYTEYALLAMVLGCVTAHGAYFGRRLSGLAERHAGTAGEARAFAKERRALQSLSLPVSQLGLFASVLAAALAANVYSAT